jgi:hypothetical protein
VIGCFLILLHFAFFSLLTIHKKNPCPAGIFLVHVLYFILTYFLVLIVLAYAFSPYCITHTTQTSTPPAEFEPATLASDRPQTHVLERSATEIGMYFYSEEDSYHALTYSAASELGFDSRTVQAVASHSTD